MEGRAVTDRLSGYVVTLEADIREDDAKKITKALGMIKGVLSVEPVIADQFAEQMWRGRLYHVLSTSIDDVIHTAVFGE